MAEPNAKIVRRAQRGEEAALVELVTGQQGYVYSIALRILGEPADAADVTQETMIRLLHALPSFRGETRFTTWLYRIVVNLALDTLRRRGPIATSLDGEGSDDNSPIDIPDLDPGVDPNVALDRTELVARIDRGLQRLTPIQRAALTMCYVEDLTYEEIADVLQAPINTVKSHIRRAKLHMAQSLAAPDLDCQCLE